jgi:hypothetical protein
MQQIVQFKSISKQLKHRKAIEAQYSKKTKTFICIKQKICDFNVLRQPRCSPGRTGRA